MVQEPLPKDAEVLQLLLRTSQAALDAYTGWLRRIQMASSVVQDYLSTQNRHEHLLQQYAEIDLADVRAWSSESPDLSLLAPYLDRESWKAALKERRVAGKLLDLANAQGLFEPDSAPGAGEVLVKAHEMLMSSAKTIVGLLRGLRDLILESLHATTDLSFEKPLWKDEALKLYFRGKCVRQLRVNAEKPRTMLQCFEEEKWTDWVEFPSDWDDQTVRETVQTLNNKLSTLLFRSANRRGRNNILVPGAEWSLRKPRATLAQAP